MTPYWVLPKLSELIQFCELQRSFFREEEEKKKQKEEKTERNPNQKNKKLPKIEIKSNVLIVRLPEIY